MRLLDTTTGNFVEKDPKHTKYAILSHTWDQAGEQTYAQLREIQKRYDSPRGLPAVHQTPSASCPSPNTSGSAMVPLPSTSITNESTPLLPDRLSLLEQGVPQGRKADSESRIIPLKRLMLSLSRRLWDLLVLLLTFVLPRRFIQAIPTGHLYDDPSSNIVSAQSSDPLELAPDSRHPTLPRSIWDDPELSSKIRDACATARVNGYQYIWIDSCCIDQSSSSELSEAINSMYVWYAGAYVCYAYLADVFPGEHHRGENSRFRKSRWFTRGWTLQELIAPLNVVFLSKNWTVIGPRHALYDLIGEITRVSEEALLHLKPLNEFSVAQRLSWAARRKTTRVEDQAYSLLGIFDLHMPTLYGEGGRAFRRLQEEIMQRIPDQSLFAWGEIYRGPPVLESNTVMAMQRTHRRVYYGPQFPSESIIATVPFMFRDNQVERSAASLDVMGRVPLEYTSCPYGIRTQFQMIPLSLLFPLEYPGGRIEVSRWYLAILGCKLVSGLPGHLLGRVCYTTPSDFGIEFLSAGWLCSTDVRDRRPRHTLYTLSPEIIERCRPQLRVVYISHHTNESNLSHPLASMLRQPQQSINLLLLAATRNALHTKGYGVVDFRSPDKTYGLTSHTLILSNYINGLTITVRFQHKFEFDGKMLKMHARVTSSERTILDSAQDSDGITMRWTHKHAWHLTRPHPYREGPLILGALAGGTRRIIMNLGLDFVHIGVYRVHIDIRDDVLPVPSPSPIGLLQGEEDGTPTPETDVDMPREAGEELDGGLRGVAATSSLAGDDGAPAEVDAEADAHFDAASDANGSMRDAGSPDPEGGSASVGGRATLGRFAFWRSQRRRQGKSPRGSGSGQ